MHQDKRAAYDSEFNVISLFEAADLSSFAHETMHYFDNLFRGMRDRGWITDQRLMDDIATIDEYSIREDGTRDYERIALAFENYLKHGKSPDSKLNKLFNTIKRIMMRIYAAVSPDYFADAPLNAEISGVFDRMLMTERQANMEFADSELLQIWKEMDLLGLSATDLKNAAAGAQLRKEQIINEVDAEKSKRWAVLKRFARREAQAQMDVIPVYGVYRELDSTGKIDGGIVLALYGRETLNRLRAKGVIAKTPRATRSGEEFHDQQDRRGRTIGLSQYNEAYDNYLYENYYPVWVMRSNNYPKIKPDKKFGILREQFGSFLNDKEGMPSDEAAQELSGLLGYEISEQQLVDTLTDLKLSDIRREFNNEYQTDKEYWNTQAENALRLSANDNLNKLAADTGYESHGKMIEDILNNPRPAEFVREHIQTRLAEFEASFPVSEYVASADAAIAQMDLLLGILSGKVGVPDYNASRDAFRAQELAKVEAMSVRDLKRSDLTLGAVKRNSRDAVTALRKGDFNTAYEAMQQARHQMEMLRLMHQMQKDVARLERRAMKAANTKPRKDGKSTIQGDILFQLQKLAFEYGLVERTPTAPAGMELDRLIEKLGGEISVDALPEVAHDETGDPDFNRMRVSDFQLLGDFMEFLEVSGRELVKQADASKKGTIAATVKEMRSTLSAQPEVKQYDETIADKAKYGLMSLTSKTRNLNAVLREADGLVNALGKTQGGIFEQTIFNRLNDMKSYESTLIQRTNTAIASHYEYLVRRINEFPDVISDNVPNLPENLNYKRGWDAVMLLSVALNWGTLNNRQKLMDGYNLTETDINQLLSKFDRAEDWTHIQGIWDKIGSLLPEVQKAYYEANYIRMKPEAAAAFTVTLADGSVTSVAGGYYPIIYDGKIDMEAKSENEMNVGMDSGNGTILRSPMGGFTKERTERTFRPVLLTSVGGIDKAITEHAHYAAFKNGMKEISAILNNNQLRSDLQKHLGRPKTSEIRNTIREIANPTPPRGDFLDRAVAYTRAAAVAYGLWGNVGSALMQLSSFSVGMTTVGMENYFEASREYWAHPMNKFNLINDMSSMMRDRYSGADKAILKDVAKIGDTGKTRLYKWMKNAGFIGIRMADAAVAYPMWLAAYNFSLNKGETQSQAIRYADKLIAETQGTGRTLDMIPMQMDRGFAGFFAMFFSAVGAYGNRLVTVNKGFKAGTVSINEMAHFYAAEVALPAVFSAAILRPLAAGTIGALWGGSDDEEAEAFACNIHRVKIT